MATPQEESRTAPVEAGGRPDANQDTERPSPTSPAGRGGRIDITETSDPVQEASEESFPASDPPSHSPWKAT